MTPPGPFHIDTTRLVLAPGGNAIPRPVTDDFYESLERDFKGFAGHSLVQRYSFSEAWPSWEMHPAGDEMVMLLSGAADLILWRGDSEECIQVDQPGQFLLVPRGTWHTARPRPQAEMLFVTPGEGTLNAAQPG